MSDISKIKVIGVEYDIKDIQAREDLGNLGTRVTELEQHGGGGQFIVNVYNTNVAGTEFAADKTYEEISAAIESGMCVVIHKKEHINAATYQVFYHNDTGNGFYKFCHITFGKKIEVHNIGIRMVDGKMVIDIRSKEIQVVTS